MISVRGPKMTGRQSLIICALTLSGPGALLSGRDLAFFLTCHSPEIKRLIDGREVDTDLLRDRYTAFLGQVQRGVCGISADSCKKTGWINLLRISYLLNKFAYKKGFLNQVARFFKTSSVNGVPCFMKSCEEANSRFHEILDFLVDKTTGSPTNLNRFHGSMDV